MTQLVLWFCEYNQTSAGRRTQDTSQDAGQDAGHPKVVDRHRTQEAGHQKLLMDAGRWSQDTKNINFFVA